MLWQYLHSFYWYFNECTIGLVVVRVCADDNLYKFITLHCSVYFRSDFDYISLLHYFSLARELTLVQEFSTGRRYLKDYEIGEFCTCLNPRSVLVYAVAASHSRCA
jgi:hypothetical protein